MATTKAGQKAVNKYVKSHYDRINVTIDKGGKAVIQAVAEKNGESINGFIKKAVEARLESETGQQIKL